MVNDTDINIILLLLNMLDQNIEERYAGVQHSAYLPTVATPSCWLVGAFSSDYMAFLLEPRVNEQKLS